MKSKRKKYWWLLLFLLFFLVKTNYFHPMSNFGHRRTVKLDMDMENAVLEGITLPSVNQCEQGAFEFKFFTLSKKYKYYKVYYQNESYKFDDTAILANENFYGSWEDVSVGFKPIEHHRTKDSFRIVGNPRDEKKYYGADLSENTFNEEHIQSVIASINNVPEWYASVVEKAEHNGCSIEEQLYKDALWIINDKKSIGDEVNHRWKRNPRVGEYSFILVLCDEQGLSEIPDYVQFIGQTDENGQFVNPYGWFKQHRSKHIKVIRSRRRLKTRAVISVNRGIFIDESNVQKMGYQIDTTSCRCGKDDSLYRNALYEQFFSSVSRQYSLRNIPVIQDVVGDNPYTREQYETNRNRFDSTELQMNWPVTTETPCQTVRLSDDGSYITLINPSNNDLNNLHKESTGIRTRVGFTYGKFRGKIKFPVMLNQEHVWNGLTYAFWLIYSDNHEWNNRRPSFAGGGYIPKNDDSENPQRTPYYYYSEIDIEIVKASKYWPRDYYPHKTQDTVKYTEDATQNDEVMYCCTNWDLACPEPEKFSSGIGYIPYNLLRKFETLRWYPNYKALTTRTPMQNKVFSEDYYYYEIEWRPTEIIWRLGPSPDKMELMGYMNDEYTCIPNNQMKAIVTQEYHYSEWWPPIVWEQGLIPYNESDIEGRVYEIVVE